MRVASLCLIALWMALGSLSAQGRQSMNEMFQRDNARIQDVAPRVGESLPDIVGYAENRQPFNLKDITGSYAVIVSGCLT